MTKRSVMSNERSRVVRYVKGDKTAFKKAVKDDEREREGSIEVGSSDGREGIQCERRCKPLESAGSEK